MTGTSRAWKTHLFERSKGVEGGIVTTMQYTNGTEIVDAIAWARDFSQIVTFLQNNPPIIDPKVLEDNPAALGVIEQDGDLVVYVGGTEVFQRAHPGDFLVRGANLKLRVIDQTTFTATFTPITP